MFTAALILATAAASRAKTPLVDTPMVLASAYLVQARVVQVDKKTLDAELVIERVYVGNNELKGRKLTITIPWGLPWIGSMHGHPASMPLVKGEVGLWWISRDASSDESKDEGRLISYIDRNLDNGLPFIYLPFSAILSGAPVSSEIHHYGDLESDPYDFGANVMLAWADAIQTVYEATGDDKRIALLKKYASSDNPPLSAWALNALSRFLEPEFKSRLFDSDGKPRIDIEQLLQYGLAKHVRKDVKSVLEDFADDPKLPIYAQVELDRVLARIDDNWPKSDRRAKMLKRWEKVKDPVDRYFIDGQLKRVKRDASK